MTKKIKKAGKEIKKTILMVGDLIEHSFKLSKKCPIIIIKEKDLGSGKNFYRVHCKGIKASMKRAPTLQDALTRLLIRLEEINGKMAKKLFTNTK